MNELKNADEIVRNLHECACEGCPADILDAADLIDSLTAQLTDYHHMEQLVDGKMAENQRLRKINEKLQSQLTESQRREKAAVEDLETILALACAAEVEGICNYCSDDGENCTGTTGWRGPQEDEKGAAE